ncbi:hypothetical protein N7532_005238 [Penicillium argentinense]|uniref:Uncharacterized protein n=1 Tax=Penicillium argentinense TaxID=1131581 RepID=A0A9W9KAR2_9EURO|nr:uncharacterized protein N7532_005238 [Penicillium argentinense]KAJ5098237.1 hypothetical protein N7532_005238 [Penicillium argentinense]
MDSTEQDIEFKTYLDALAGRITATLTVRNLECLRRQHRNIQRERRLYHALGLPAPETVFEHLFNKLPVDNNSFERLNRFDRDGNPERKNRGNRVDGSRQNRFDRARNNFLDRDDDFYLTFTFNNRTRFNSQVRSESPPSSVAGSLASIDVGEKAFSFSQSQSESTSCCDHSASCGGPSASCDDHTPRKSILRHDIPDPYDDKTDFSFSRSTSSNDDSTDRTDRDTVSVYNGNTLNGIPKFKFRNGSSTRDRKSLDRFNVQFDSSYDLTYDGDDEHNSYEEGVERLKLNCGSPTSVYGLQSNNPSTSDDEVNALDKPDSTMVGFALPDCEMPKPVVPSAEHSAGAMAYESLIGSNPYIGSPDSSTYGVQETGWTDPRPYITSTLAAQEIDLTGPYDSLGEDYPYIGSYIDSYIDGPDSSTHGAQETDTSPTRHYPYIDGLDSNIYGNQEIDWTDPELFLQPKTYCRETDERDCTITPEPFEKTPDVTTPDD